MSQTVLILINVLSANKLEFKCRVFYIQSNSMDSGAEPILIKGIALFSLRRKLAIVV